MTLDSQADREEEELWRQLAEGEISKAEYQREMRELRSDYQAAAQEAAMRVYEDEMERW